MLIEQKIDSTATAGVKPRLPQLNVSTTNAMVVIIFLSKQLQDHLQAKLQQKCNKKNKKYKIMLKTINLYQLKSNQIFNHPIIFYIFTHMYNNLY